MVGGECRVCNISYRPRSWRCDQCNSELLPHVMIRRYEPMLQHGVWVDFIHRNQTKEGLEDKLGRMLRDGQIMAWRWIYIDKEATQ